MNDQISNSENFLFPVFLKLEEQHVLLVGAGPVGYEKATAILRNSPKTKLRVVAELVSEEVRNLQLAHPQITIQARSFQHADLDKTNILFLAVNNKELSASIREKAHEKNILVNVADTPDLCDFYMSSIVQKGNLKIAISTNGKSPTIAKRLREFLEENLPTQLDELLENMNRIREKLKGNFSDKVKQLNELTASLNKKEDTTTE